MRSLGRVLAAAAGLLMLLAPTAAFGSWWDGGYSARGYSEHGYPDDGWREPVPPPSSGPLYGCENSTLPGTGSGLLKTTTPPPGTPVRPGDEIVVEISWRVWDWAGPDLHKAIDCVYINGVFAPGLSGGEKPTPNDGHFAFHYFVPLDVPPGSTICDQGFVSGPNGHEDYAREVSNVVCFPVGTPPPPPCCVEQAPPPCDCVPETTTTTMAPTTTTTMAPTTTTTVPEEEAEPYANTVLSEQEQAPPLPPAPPTRVQAEDVLPRTGGDAGLGVRLAGGALALAGLMGRLNRRRVERPSQP
jgi:hypothetical protein